MHRGRRYPQIVHRWACPDFLTSEYAPLTLLYRFQVFDTLGFGHDVSIETGDWHVDPTTGETYWLIPSLFIGLNFFEGNFRQLMCGAPSTRHWEGNLVGASGTIGWTMHFLSNGVQGYGPGPLGSFPPDTSHCTGFWTVVTNIGFCGKPYF
jgi:hypothetical protein